MKWTDEEHLLLIGYAEQRWTARQIAAALGRSRNATIGHAQRTGVKLLAPHGFWIADTVRRLDEMYQASRRLDDIAAELGTTRIAVRDQLAKRKRKGMLRPRPRIKGGPVPHRWPTRPARPIVRFGNAVFAKTFNEEFGRADSKVGLGWMVPNPDHAAVSFFDLADNHCRFIPGAAAAEKTMYCGAPVIAYSSYCSAHHAKCHGGC